MQLVLCIATVLTILKSTGKLIAFGRPESVQSIVQDLIGGCTVPDSCWGPNQSSSGSRGFGLLICARHQRLFDVSLGVQSKICSPVRIGRIYQTFGLKGIVNFSSSTERTGTTVTYCPSHGRCFGHFSTRLVVGIPVEQTARRLGVAEILAGETV